MQPLLYFFKYGLILVTIVFIMLMYSLPSFQTFLKYDYYCPKHST